MSTIKPIPVPYAVANLGAAAGKLTPTKGPAGEAIPDKGDDKKDNTPDLNKQLSLNA